MELTFFRLSRPVRIFVKRGDLVHRAFATPSSHARLQPLLRAPRPNEPAVSDQSLFQRAAAADRHWWWLTPLLLAALLLPGLGSAGLLDPWEMDRAAVARKMAAAPAVLVVEPGTGHLLDDLSKQTAGRYALAHPFDLKDATAGTALQLAVSRSARQVSHAIVVDLDGLTAGDDKQLKSAVGQLATIEAQNRGTAILLVSAGRDLDRLRWPFALARAHQLAETLRGSVLHSLFEPETQDIVLAPLYLKTLETVTPDRVAATLDTRCPAPLAMPAFKQDSTSVSAPWLDSLLAAVAIKAVHSPVFLLGAACGTAVPTGAPIIWQRQSPPIQ